MRRKRDSRLVEKRNQKLCARYYYWTEVQRLRSDDAIHQLSEEEFFISEATVLSILKRAQRMGNAELKKLAALKRPPKAPRITAEMLALMPDRLDGK